MDKPFDAAKGGPSVKGVMRRLLIDLKEVPKDEQPKDDVPPLPHFSMDLLVPKEEMETLKEQYKVLGSSSVAARGRVHYKDLGFDESCVTLMCIKDKKVEFPGKSLYALGRSWFKEGFIKKDKALDVDCMTSFPKGKDKDKVSDDKKDSLAAKKLLQDFVKQAKARARIAKMKGKTVQKRVRFAPTPANETQKEVRLARATKVQKKVSFAPAPAPAPPPHRGTGIRRKRRVQKTRSIRDIMANTERMPDA